MLRILFALITLLSLCTHVQAGKRVALVIGNGAYEHVTPLVNPVNDATLMAGVLADAGFEVIRQDNLTRDGMKRAMVEFGRKLKQGAEAGLFYYAGHGVEIDGKNYLVPIDSDMQSKEEADIFNFNANEFLALMENSGVPFNIIVLDACRNNPFRSLRATGGGLAPVNAPVGTYVAYATAPGAVAADGEGQNSPFAAALAESIKTPGLALEEVFKLTRTKVRAATGGQQVPFDSSAIEGSFFFNVIVVNPPPEPAPVPPPQQVTDSGETAFKAAGDDIGMLNIVADSFPDTVWGKLARERIKMLEAAKLAVADPTPAEEKRKIAVVPAPEKLPETPTVNTDVPDAGEVAFKSAGLDVSKLKAVVDNFPDTEWSAAAASRIKTLEERANAIAQQNPETVVNADNVSITKPRPTFKNFGVQFESAPEGLLITSVDPNKDAFRLKVQPGDTIALINNKKVQSFEDLLAARREAEEQNLKSITITVVKRDKRGEFENLKLFLE